MPCRFASSGTVATSRSASRAILALNVASNFLRDLVISVLHRLRQSRTLHTLTFGPISGVHFNLPPTGGGSHWKITAADEEAILTIPAKRPIKPVYVRKLLAMMGRRGDGEAD